MTNLTEIKTANYHYFKDEAGNLQGECKWWHDTGQLREHCFYVNGNKHGEYKWYTNNGQLRIHCFYVNGELHGEYKWYKTNGQLLEHCFYMNDKLHGEYKRWNDNSQLRTHCLYVNDEETDIPIPTCDEDKFAICLEYGHMGFISIENTENTDD